MRRRPSRAAIRKDLAYAYLKIGENVLAREEFREAMRLDPADFHVALEYAFLCHDTNRKAAARRVFDRVRQAGDPESRKTAEEAFRNVDGPLAAGIARWTEAIRVGGANRGAHYDLAVLAEERDELELAAGQYEKAWRLDPSKRSVLVDLGRVLKALNRVEQANAALIAAGWGGEARAAEAARELLPARYPYVPEFRAALALDPANIELRRELAYLLLRMDRQAEAEEEFRVIAGTDEHDLLSAAQLGFLLLARGDRASAMPLLERVMRGDDEDLANRVRAVLRIPQVLRKRASDSGGPTVVDTREMAERSFRAGYINDALKYLEVAHEADPSDSGVILKLAWTHNLLRDDRTAVRWFDLARKSPDARVAAEGLQAYRNLRESLARIRSDFWVFPFYSSRWKTAFSYAQWRTEARLALPFRPYVSLRFVGDSRSAVTPGLPQQLSEGAVIGGIGVASRTWRGVYAWGEAGSAFAYLTRHVTPDYRAGVSLFRGFGHGLSSERPGWFAETAADAVFASRFDRDVLFYSQSRLGYTVESGGLKVQVHMNANATADARAQYWANFVEGGPGVRFRWSELPESLYFTVNLLRGTQTRNAGNPRRPNFTDFRAGFGYAFRY